MSADPTRSPRLCRDCHTVWPHATPRCPTCRSARWVEHAELETLAIAHVDCDAFFAAIEKRDDPAIAPHPVIVGGGTRGVVSTCCYIARSFGVRSAMPMFKALALCPDAVVRKPRFDAYTEAAKGIRAAMDAITPLVQPISIDEAFLDLSGTTKLHDAPPAVTLSRLARAIEDDIGITVSVGLSHNKFLAKLASDLEKPRGFAIIGKAETETRLAPMPARAIFGVGKVLGDRLARDGYKTLGDLQAASVEGLAQRYGETGVRLSELCRGQDRRVVRPNSRAKSISAETTFNTDLDDLKELSDALYRLAQRVSKRAKDKSTAGRVVTLKLKTSRFQSRTRRTSLPHPTNLAHIIHETASALLHAEEPEAKTTTPYRLIGVGVSDLSPADDMDADFLFPDAHRRISDREAAVDALRDRFGADVIGTLREQRKRPPNT